MTFVGTLDVHNGRWGAFADVIDLDVGAGDSPSTWQAAAGIRHGYEWGDLSLLWRYIDYDMKSGKSIESANLSGPMVGATFRW
jgi:hypothetical protein